MSTDVTGAVVDERFEWLVTWVGSAIFEQLARLSEQDNSGRRGRLEAAQRLIDVLEMLEEKTRGNLSEPETRLLAEMLMAVRLAYLKGYDSGSPASPACTAG